VAVKSGVFLRDYVYVFLQMMAADLTRDVVQQAIDSAIPEEPNLLTQ